MFYLAVACLQCKLLSKAHIPGELLQLRFDACLYQSFFFIIPSSDLWETGSILIHNWLVDSNEGCLVHDRANRASVIMPRSVEISCRLIPLPPCALEYRVRAKHTCVRWLAYIAASVLRSVSGDRVTLEACTEYKYSHIKNPGGWKRSLRLKASDEYTF